MRSEKPGRYWKGNWKRRAFSCEHEIFTWETGVFDGFGDGLFTYSITRAFYDGDSIQADLRFIIYFPPDAELAVLKDCLLSCDFASCGAFFAAVEQCASFLFPVARSQPVRYDIFYDDL